jgi:hypothetical protein
VSSKQQLHYLNNPTPDILKASAIEFIESLKGPVVIDITGKDNSRTRVITTLIHGNEPSGLIAFHQWFEELTTTNSLPSTNIRIIIPSTVAALYPPLFSTRFMPGCKDLNRCFGQEDDSCEQIALANEIEVAIRAVRPEAVIDIHNTSGSSPAFSVAIRSGDSEKNLAAFFCNQLIHTQIKLGAVMELDFKCPIVTIECGGSEDAISIKRAYHGIKQFTELDDLKIELKNETVDVHKNPIRVMLNPGLSLAYADTDIADIDLVLVADNERRNFGVTHKGTFLGWIKGTCSGTLSALNQQQKNICEELFEIKQGKLFSRRDLNFFMATDRANIAIADCLFYVTSMQD